MILEHIAGMSHLNSHFADALSGIRVAQDTLLPTSGCNSLDGLERSHLEDCVRRKV